ncbi:excalibur calcium-binding domain-containing protein [Cryobacterium sp. 1639]|nr:excalibur calcium-binding domain-containing protein [Cryobacterium sp. 1639]
MAYKNCTALVAAYPHGVAKAGIKVNLANGTPRVLKGPPFFSTAVYTLNKKSDRDKDGIACER